MVYDHPYSHLVLVGCGGHVHDLGMEPHPLHLLSLAEVLGRHGGHVSILVMELQWHLLSLVADHVSRLTQTLLVSYQWPLMFEVLDWYMKILHRQSVLPSCHEFQVHPHWEDL